MEQLVPLALLAPILVWVAWTDFSAMRIRNVAVLATLAIWGLTAPLVGWEEAGVRLGAAGATFAVALCLFAAGMVGGGDAKMGPALLLVVPSTTLAPFALLFAAAILTWITVLAILRAVPAVRRSGPVSLRARGHFPMGLAMASAGLLHLGALGLAG